MKNGNGKFPQRRMLRVSNLFIRNSRCPLRASWEEFPGIIRAYKSRITEEKLTGPRHDDHKRRNGKI